MEQVEIQLQNTVTRNWITMRTVVNTDWTVQKALDELKNRYPTQPVRALFNGMLINMRP